jgi:hypothetical protein
VRGHNRLIAAVGLKDIVIIDSGDALLVVSRMLKNTKINRDRLKLLENFSYSLP